MEEDKKPRLQQQKNYYTSEQYKEWIRQQKLECHNQN